MASAAAVRLSNLMKVLIISIILLHSLSSQSKPLRSTTAGAASFSLPSQAIRINKPNRADPDNNRKGNRQNNFALRCNSNNNQIIAKISDEPPIEIPTATSRPFRPSSLPKINSLMFFFYATLGSAMPFLPIYYRRIGISGND